MWTFKNNKRIEIIIRFVLIGFLLLTGKSIPVEALTVEEQAKVKAAENLAQHIYSRDFDIDSTGVVNSLDIRIAGNVAADSISVQILLDPKTKGRLDRNVDGVLDDVDVREVFRLFLLNYARIQRDIAIQKRDEFTTQLEEEKVLLESDQNRIPKMIDWSVALLKELRNIVKRVKLAGISPEYTPEINDYMSQVASKLDPNNPTGVPIRFPQLLNEYINSRIKNYQEKIDFWNQRRLDLLAYRDLVLAAATRANLEALLVNFPPRGVVPNPPRLLDFSELGLWNSGGLENGLIHQGINLAVKVLSWKTDEQVISVLRPLTASSQVPRLGLYWSTFFNQESDGSAIQANSDKMRELASYGIRYLFRVSLPPIESLNSEKHQRILELFANLREHDIQSEVTPMVIDDDTWSNYATWLSQELPKYASLAYLNGIAGIYAGHEMLKPFWNRRIRSQIFTNIKNAGFPNSYVRFYYGSFETLVRPLKNTGNNMPDPLLGKWHDTAVWAGDCDAIHIALNKADGTEFLYHPDRIRLYVAAALFRVYANEAFPSGVKRFVHMNVPSLSELPSTVIPSQLHARIGYALAVLGQLGAADVVMLRVSSVASGGQSLDPDVVDIVSGMKIYLTAIRKAKRILDEAASLADSSILSLPLAEEETTQSAPKKHANVFNPIRGQTVSIGVTLTEPSHVVITLFNQRGETVRRLVDQDFSAGDHAPTWDGRNEEGSLVTSGVYLARITEGRKNRSLKLVMIK